MKTRDMIYLLLAVTIFLVAGYLGYTQLMGPKQSGAKTVTVEVVGSIPATLNDAALQKLNDTAKVQDYDSPVDLTNLGNLAPFGK